jgi:hypothetical protein
VNLRPLGLRMDADRVLAQRFRSGQVDSHHDRTMRPEPECHRLWPCKNPFETRVPCGMRNMRYRNLACSVIQRGGRCLVVVLGVAVWLRWPGSGAKKRNALPTHGSSPPRR